MAVLAIGALGWTLFDLQGQIDEVRELAAVRELSTVDSADAPETSSESWVEAIATLYREAEWAEENLLPVELGTEASWVHFRTQEKRWRWDRVLKAMDNAECSRQYIARVRDVEEWEPPLGTPEDTVAKRRLILRIALIREAAAESEKELAKIRGEPLSFPFP